MEMTAAALWCKESRLISPTTVLSKTHFCYQPFFFLFGSNSLFPPLQLFKSATLTQLFSKNILT